MEQITKEDLSLMQYIKNTVLRNYIEAEEQVELTRVYSSYDSYVYQAQSTMWPKPTSRGRGWCYFDCPIVDVNGNCVYDSPSSCIPEFVTASGTDAAGNACVGTPEQSRRVIVYDEFLSEIDESLYAVDYVDGRIIMATDQVIPKVVDYNWNYISVVDEWQLLASAETPIIVLDLHGINTEGYQLGAGRHITRPANIHIFAKSGAERNELMEVIHNGLYNKSAPVYEFTTGDVLSYDGTFFNRLVSNNKLTSLFNRTTLDDLGVLHGNMIFSEVTSRHINLPLLGPIIRLDITQNDLNTYRAVVSFNIETYTRA